MIFKLKLIAFFATLISVFWVQNLMAQINFSDSYKYSKQVIYQEDFTNNNNTWWIGDNADATTTIKNGYYTLEWKNNNVWFSFITVDINTKKDFEIESSIEILKGDGGNLYGLIFGKKDNGTYCDYLINKDQGCCIRILGDGKTSFYKPGADKHTAPIYETGKSNHFLIRKVGTQVYFFMNESLIKSATFQDFEGQQIGFTLWNKTKIAVDYLKISYIEEKHENANQSTTQNNQQANNANQFIPKSDVDKNIPDNKLTAENRFFLIIGNEDYASQQSDLTSESNVDFARFDAMIFKEYAKKIWGAPEENIILLLDATGGKINQAIAKMNLIAKNTNGNAELYFYYAGHGLPNETTKEPYLIPVDVSGSNLDFAIKLKDVYQKLTEYPSKKVVFFLDACFSGGARNQGLLAARGVKVKPKEETLKGNILVFSASSEEQYSLQYKEKQHGMFTYFLLKKLQESAGNISYKELSDFLIEKVGLKSVLINNKEQKPQLNISSAIIEKWESWRVK